MQNWIKGAAVLFLLLLAACGSDEVALGPPEGWEGADARWWQAEVEDTAAVFRDLETLGEMGIAEGEAVYAVSRQAAQSGMAQEQIAEAVKRSLIRLYRTRPEVVDSLFERYVRPDIEATPFSGDLGDYVERFKEEGYREIRKHFREPLTTLSLGRDVPVVVPDSLRGKVGGTVRTQVFLNSAGEPVAVELVEGVHPVLDQIALRATTQMRWQPAYVRGPRDWEAIPSWTRFNVIFSQQPG